MIDPDSFRQFEHQGWQGIPQQYHQAFGDLTTQSIGPLLDAAGVKEGTKVIDIATGPGYVAAAAARRGAAVVGVDFSTAMIADARRRHPDVDFREGDAEHLPFGDASFEAAVMNFGLLHLGRPDRALAEACRVLRAGGRFAFTVWAKPEEAVSFGIVLGAIAKHGDPNVPLPEGPPFFRFSEPEESIRSLVAADFASPHVVKVPQIWRLPSIDSLFEIMKDSTVRTAGLLRGQEAGALIKIREAIRECLTKYQKPDAVELPMPAILASGVKPRSG
ncbi:MAG TPA: methyltransferase domain-containing protein [Candidatus Binatia bacterium]|nr:methyltransferase domain-containing protein [Candidatus Binatia bacterium]